MKYKLITNSSQIKQIGYDEEKRIFEVVYINNRTYHYYDVSPDLWEEATSAESAGKFVNAKIKSHKYKYIGDEEL